ncbi:hypothetical protein LAB17_002087 [Salmonella enterica subsp. enterica serovar Newport]|nr:hypothetical protein [Salmonella enterica subsp. enterica serovar Newport]EJO8623325.1 hypothetical protein [Salmonella enterica subsp. enterica serovar Newport]
MTKVVWGSGENKKCTPIIRGAEKCGNNEFVIPLLNFARKDIQINEEIINSFLHRVNMDKPNVVAGGTDAVKWEMKAQRVIVDIDRVIGRVKRAWLKDDIVYAVIHLTDRPEAMAYASMLEEATIDIDVFVPYVCNCPSVKIRSIGEITPIVCLNRIVLNRSVENEDRSMTVTVEQLEPVADKIVTPAVMRSIVVDNSVLNNESIILRGITPTEDGKALSIRIPELNNRRVFIGCVGYEVLYFDTEGRAVIATKSKLFNQHKAQVSATQPYRLAYSEDKVTIWFVNGNDTLNSAFPEKTFKPVTLIEMFGGEAYVAGIPGQFRLPSCCEFKTEDVITVNGTRVSLIRIDTSSGFAVFEPHGKILENLKEACKISEPFGDERNLIIVKRTDENRVEITVSQPITAKTK